MLGEAARRLGENTGKMVQMRSKSFWFTLVAIALVRGSK